MRRDGQLDGALSEQWAGVANPASEAAPQNENDAVQSRSRNLSLPARGPFGTGGAASHLSGLALDGSEPRLSKT